MSNDVYPIIGLAVFAMYVFKQKGVGDFFGWCGATLVLYSLAKAVVLLPILACTYGLVFPVPSDPYLHVPSMTAATVVVGCIYYICLRKRRATCKTLESQR